MNAKAKYAVRAVKYFFYFSTIFFLIVGALRISGLAGGNLASMFKDGWTSLGQIAALFAVVSAFYPKLGFTKRKVEIPDQTDQTDQMRKPVEPDQRRQTIIDHFESRGYRLESESDGELTFRLRSKVSAFCKMLEDRVTLTRCESGFEIEGLTKEIVRIAGSLEHKLRG